MRKAVIFLLSFSLFFVFGASIQAAGVSDSIAKKADHAYNSNLKNTALTISYKQKGKQFNYKSRYIPIKDLFGGYVDSVSWDAKKKVALVGNQGKVFVLNVSGKEITPLSNQIVAPTEWTRISKGSVEIKASVIAYVFDRYGNTYKDKEREAWREKLDFLDIKETDGLPGIRDGYLHVSLTYNDK